MKEKRKKLIRTGVVWSVALLGLFTAQSGLMIRGWKLEKAAFSQNVHNALGSLVAKLENRETIEAMYSIVFTTDSIEARQFFIQGHRDDSLAVVISPGQLRHTSGATRHRFLRETREIRAEFDTLTPVQRLQVTAVAGRIDSATCQDTVFRSTGHFTLPPEADLSIVGFDTDLDSLALALATTPNVYWTMNGDTVSTGGRRIMVERLLNNLKRGEALPVLSRLESVALDSLVQATLQENGIDSPAQFAIIAQPGDSLIYHSPDCDRNALLASPHRIKLYPNDLRSSGETLALTFSRGPFWLFRHLSIFGVTVLGFLLVIILASASLFRRALHQQHFARTLIDFINNMTHEFKTPISTISLISENLLSNQTELDAQRQKRYGRIIQDESLRMRGQVEKILQMASLETGDIELKIEPVPVHALIDQIVNNMTPMLQRQQGRFRLRLAAVPDIVSADRHHLSNMLVNLVDNAIKYSPDTPDILIETHNEDSRLLIAVKDNGLGLSAVDAEHVFDKYFRVTTGNVHNVKGFGLGLAYVKIMAEAHGGQIQVESKINVGSTFTLSLPLEES